MSYLISQVFEQFWVEFFLCPDEINLKFLKKSFLVRLEPLAKGWLCPWFYWLRHQGCHHKGMNTIIKMISTITNPDSRQFFQDDIQLMWKPEGISETNNEKALQHQVLASILIGIAYLQVSKIPRERHSKRRQNVTNM